MSVALVLSTGCDALYDDLRETTLSGPTGSDGGAAAPDGGTLPPGTDASAPPSFAPRTAMWQGRGGYEASGTVTFERGDNGRLQVRFGEDFSTQGVPGPVVVLSTRESLNGSAPDQAGDFNLGVLQSTSGAQVYEAPPGSENARFVWVYCLPFRVEIARATLPEGI